ncbi:hypothetical protein [Paenibacillus elgii]|uniref:hypothetical protein n=1 Tax=Paenibacillus elgii TaxID=189691 RepID=UPI000248C183|nr:hypothetical protein [Paenibacillus elgii]
MFGNGIAFPNTAVAQAPDGTIAGFGLSIQGPVRLTLGPITAPNDYTALALVDSLANGHPGKLRIDVAAEHPTFAAPERKPLQHCGADFRLARFLSGCISSLSNSKKKSVTKHSPTP